MQESHVTSMPLLGDTFPEMEVQTTHGPMSLPGDMKKKWFVLFSHPADFTPVCTTEFYSFQQHFQEFQELNCELIGLSVDQVFSHIKWVEWIHEKLGTEIEFPVIAATESIAAKLGMIHPGKGSHTVRAVFIVDPDGILRTVFYYPPEIGRNMSEVVRAVKALQTSDEKDCATPANWPENELIGDKVIVPPATNVEAAKKRLTEYDNYDWWFCYRNCE